MGALDHLVLLARELVPAILGLGVDLRQLPLAQGVGLAALEAAGLLVLGDAEVELDQDRALTHQILFEAHDAIHKILVLLLGAEAEDRFDHGAVVPAPVEEHHLATGRELGDVALEEPLMALLLGGLAEGDEAVALFVHVARDTANGAALAGGVATLEDDDHPGLGLFQVPLHADELGLIGLEALFLPAADHGAAVLALALRELVTHVPVIVQQLRQFDLLSAIFDKFRVL